MENAIKILGKILMGFLVIEVGVRLVLTLFLGSSMLWYGTPWAATTHAFTQTAREKQATAQFIAEHFTVNLHEAQHQGYSKYRPNQQKTDTDQAGQRFSVTINRQGFRGEDFKPKTPGTLRIVCLGASSTFGYRSRDHETYPVYLAQQLGVDVLNLGIPHLRVREVGALLDGEGFALHPDIVTYYGGWNDAQHTLPQQFRQQVSAPLKRFVKRFVLVEWMLAISRDRTRFSLRDVHAHLKGRAARFVEGVRSLSMRCAQEGVQFYVITQQARSLLVDEASVAGISYNQEVALVQTKLRHEQITTAERNFLTHATLMDALDTDPTLAVIDGRAALDRARHVLMSEIHLAPQGNWRLATAIATRVIKEGR